MIPDKKIPKTTPFRWMRKNDKSSRGRVERKTALDFFFQLLDHLFPKGATCKEAGAYFWLMLGIPLYQSDTKLNCKCAENHGWWKDVRWCILIIFHLILYLPILSPPNKKLPKMISPKKKKNFQRCAKGTSKLASKQGFLVHCSPTSFSIIVCPLPFRSSIGCSIIEIDRLNSFRF